MRRTRKTAITLTIAAALTLTGTTAATADVGGPEGYVGTKTGPGIANIYTAQVYGDMLSVGVDINVTGKAYTGKIDSTLRKPDGTIAAKRTLDLRGQKTYQLAWAFDKHLKKGSKYYMTAHVPAAYGHKAATLKTKVLTVK
ncbi:hypothetical protein [Curtobacterium sp. MCSS17_016]|uniref:hypothetical protein n=1 Tax=Curtobacterium sp. MCSS17_016 TaxID=2175644 RepID=UPI000DA7A7F2|nr:hypothetical protein [Curtobacterium sp. MCSS17_016]WIE80981.1 hypothetical protein DEJ19_020910 [Curtobacterium sp. MCSS17_016]